jgi:hypothetical protein
LRKDRFSELRKSQLMQRAACPFKIIEKINDNAYKLELPLEFGVSSTFNIADLSHTRRKDELALRMTWLQEGDDKEDITLLDRNNTPHMDIQGPVTRSRAHQLNQHVSSFLCTFGNCENDMLPNNVMIVRNNGEDHKMFGETWRKPDRASKPS